MDIQLPDMDGVAALGLLRADPRTAAIPAVALTAFAMKEDSDRFLGAGFDGYLGKPIDIKTFPSQVRAFVEAGAHPPTEQMTGDGDERQALAGRESNRHVQWGPWFAAAA